MTEFKYSFTVQAPVDTVTAFHHDTRVLKQLTPFPIVAQIHDYEPLADKSEAKFTLWFGPIPVRWHAVHSDVSPAGFTDT
jgi:ligand-binding SRPBCC domain-containing protein